MHGLVQSACTSLNVFFSSMGLRISAQSWRQWFLLRNIKDVMFQIFGYSFRCWVAMELHAKICAEKMLPKSAFIEICGRCFLGSTSVLFDTAV
jgi:hypothetical protein